MTQTLTISRKAPESKAKDFEFLKDQALRYIQLVAGNHWTDYNPHDPGITLLEQLCYAINDLANRTSFDMQDLLAEENGKQGEQKHFFTAREILTCNPVSMDDFRRVMIDTPGIKNAWLEPKIEDNFYSDGPAFYHDQKEKGLLYKGPQGPESDTELLNLNGLYDVLLEFENHPDFGDLNSNSINAIIDIRDDDDLSRHLKIAVNAEFPYWDDPIFPNKDISELSQLEREALIHRLLLHLEDIDLTIYEKSQDLKINISVDQDQGRPQVTISIIDKQSGEQVPDLQVKSRNELELRLSNIASTYLDKVHTIRNVVKQVSHRLHQHRNLCEDFINFKSLKVKQIALCLKVELKHNAVPAEVHAKLYHAVEHFLAPQLKWSTLEELMARRVPTDKIFEGPALNSGFLTEEELAVSDRRKMLYVSDLINVISDIPGIEFLSEIEIGVKEGKTYKEQEDGDVWHIKIEENAEDFYIPRLNLDHSNVRFYKNHIPLSTSRDDVDQIMLELKAEMASEATGANDIALPKGKARNVADYPSIQYDFPSTYGIGHHGVAPTETDERKAKARQLKAYLLIFEQVLANYLAQLQNINRLFSLDTDIDHSYFTQNLYDVPEVASVLKDFMDGIELPLDGSEPDLGIFKTKWKDFMKDLDNQYMVKLQEITEGQKNLPGGIKGSVFNDRRNRFLDHLMARFGEQIDDYANIIHSIDLDTPETQLIKDKSNLLKDYPTISANRSKAFNYQSELNTNTQQVSGLELRIARLLGIDLFNLSGSDGSFEQYKDEDGKYRFKIRNGKKEVVLAGTVGFNELHELNEQRRKVFEAARKKKNYQKKTHISGKFYFNLLDDKEQIIARSQKYYDKVEQGIEEIFQVTEDLRKLDEKLLIIEHILLRPKVREKDELLPVYFPEESSAGEAECCTGGHDPYSFVISVVLPSWPKRFRNLDFRRLVERKIREETPAHIYPRICWVDMADMAQLEKKLVAWKKSVRGVDFNDDLFMAKISGNFDDYYESLIAWAAQLLKKDLSQLTLNDLNPLLERLGELTASAALEVHDRDQILRLIDLLEKAGKLLIRTKAQNELIETMNQLRNVYPEATLYDCDDNEAENPIALNRTKLGTFKPEANE